MQRGVLVLLKDDRFPPFQWAIGRIIDVHPGEDGIIRVITIKTAEGQFKRSARNICLLSQYENLPRMKRD